MRSALSLHREVTAGPDERRVILLLRSSPIISYPAFGQRRPVIIYYGRRVLSINISLRRPRASRELFLAISSSFLHRRGGGGGTLHLVFKLHP